ncbi:MAG: histidine phosphatase family protein [Dehalococcoidia bacterium]|nr:histidine phosphatase family protein [Dehalococcoidia bacterium]
MKLRIVRHAESTGNAQGRWQGRDDTLLTELGRKQAAKLRERFTSEGYQPSHIYSSPLSRTLETAQIASSAWDIPIVQVDDLMETDIGVFAGKTWQDIEEQMPEVAREFTVSRNLDLVDGAETYTQRSDRAQRVVDLLTGEHTDDDSVLVFTHGGIISHIFAQLVGTDRMWGLGVRNTAMFEFTIAVERWQLDGLDRVNSDLRRINLFNDASHLD